MLIYRDREPFLGLLLADHVFVEEALDLVRLRQIGPNRPGGRISVVIDDLVADINALVADIYTRAGDEFANIVLRFTAKRAGQEFLWTAELAHSV